MNDKLYALLGRDGRIYSLRPLPRSHPLAGRGGFKWQSYCEGTPWRCFRSKHAFEEAVRFETAPEVWGPHGEATAHAVAWSELEGALLLERLASRSSPPSQT